MRTQATRAFASSSWLWRQGPPRRSNCCLHLPGEYDGDTSAADIFGASSSLTHYNSSACGNWFGRSETNLACIFELKSFNPGCGLPASAYTRGRQMPEHEQNAAAMPAHNITRLQ